jgi:hypothetical protein
MAATRFGSVLNFAEDAAALGADLDAFVLRGFDFAGRFFAFLFIGLGGEI